MTRMMWQHVFLVFAATQILMIPAQNPPSEKDICTKTEMNISCSDCRTMEICIPNKPKLYVNCTGDAPWCDIDGQTTKCSKTTTNWNCGGASVGSFICPAGNDGDGFYPDGNMCNKFHMCLKGRGFDLDCPIQNSVFSPLKNACVRPKPRESCTKVICKGSGTRAAHLVDPSISFLCLNDQPVLVDKCSGGLVFDMNKQKCVFKCREEGIFPNPENKRAYYECTDTVGSGLQMVTRICPSLDKEESYFDETKKICQTGTKPQP